MRKKTRAVAKIERSKSNKNKKFFNFLENRKEQPRHFF